MVASDIRPVKRALISVSNKEPVLNLAKTLCELNVEILSTGRTAKFLREHNIPTIDVTDVTQFPEIMAGRVKTLHPAIHAGILARRGQDDEVLATLDIQTIDLVIVNLYPFAKTISQKDCTDERAIENIDIGGPTLLRAAAKNHQYVTVIVNDDDCEIVRMQLIEQNGTTAELRRELAYKVFNYCAHYDSHIAAYLNPTPNELPEQLTLAAKKIQTLRYGENPHQKAGSF